MYTITVTYASGKDFTRDHIEKVVYTYTDGREVVVEDDALFNYHFPITEDLKDMLVYAADGTSTVSGKNIRSISIVSMDEL